MSKVFVTSDWHLGHRNILKYRSQFSSIEEHNLTLFNNYKAVVGKRDLVYFLGDTCFTEASIELLKALPGRKRLVLGNHDLEHPRASLAMLYDVFEEITSLRKYKGFWLSHAPIHSDELRGKFNIHGHTHNYNLQDSRYANACVENCNYYPIDITEIKQYMENGFEFTKR